MKRKRQHRPWTYRDDDWLAELVTQGMGNTEIGKTMGRARQVIQRKRSGEYGLSDRAKHRVIDDADFKIVIPDEVIADRDRRLALQPRDLTALLMGDPVENRHGR